MSATSAEELDSWKASFLRVGVHPEYIGDSVTTEDTKEEEVVKESNDPQLERQGTIYIKIYIFFRNVKKILLNRKQWIQ